MVSIAGRWPITSFSSGLCAPRHASSSSTGRAARHRDDLARGRSHRLVPGVSAAHDAYKPFESLPAELIDAILIQPAHAAPAFGAPGDRPRLEDPRRLELASRPGRRSRLARTQAGSWSGPGGHLPRSHRRPFASPGLPRACRDTRRRPAIRGDSGAFPGRERRVDAGRSAQPAQ